MQKRNARQNKRSIISSLLMVGVGIGWLIGLSISPVVSIVITTVTGSAATIIAALSGLEDKQDEAKETDKRTNSLLRWNVDPLPLTILVIGILVGSLIGMKARNDGWLGTNLSIEVQKWKNVGIVQAGITEKELVRRLFESQYYTNTTPLAVKPVQDLGTILFNSSSSECQGLMAASTRTQALADASLSTALGSSTVIQLRELPNIITDTLVLSEVVEKVLCADGLP